jgi:hypothetical protein
MRLLKLSIVMGLFSGILVFAQYSKYTVSDYFLFIPIQYLGETFVANSTGESAAMRDGVLGEAFVDLKNGYISQRHPVDSDLINEFVVWKSKNQADIIAISGRLDFKRYKGIDSSPQGNLSNGLNQYLSFYRFVRGEWFEYNNFLPNKNILLQRVTKKHPELLKYKKIWRFACILPRVGTTARIVLYVGIKESGVSRVIMKDLYKLVWKETDFSVSPI